MPSPEICIIAAVSENGVIGKDGQIPWRIPEDMKNFRRLTTGHPIIMGRKTFESLGKPLPLRTNIVLSRDTLFLAKGCLRYNDLESAIEVAKKIDKDRIFIIGGGQIYQQSIDIADVLFLTKVTGEFEGDTFFPNYSQFNRVISCQSGESSGYIYRFLELERKDKEGGEEC